jgi:hypothetical protein
MAQEFTNFAKDFMLDALDTGVIYISAHTATPGLTGANETSGGAPAYARQLAGYNAASGGSMALTATETLDINAGVTITYLGIFDAVTGGNFLGQVLIADEAFGSQGTLDVTALTLALDQDP